MGQFYWLKLKKDFFKRHQMVILRAMENGMMYEAIFIHLMAESIDHEAKLRFSESKPYSPRTLAPLVGTDTQTMSDALEIFADLELIEILEDGTIFVPLASENIGSATDNANANRQRRYRERQAEQAKNNANDTDSITECNGKRYGSITKHNESIEIRDKRIENRDKIVKEEEKEEESVASSSEPPTKTKARFQKPTVEEVRAYCTERQNGVDAQRFFDYYESNGWKVGKNNMKDWKASVRTWERRESAGTKKKEELPYLENTYSEDDLRKMICNPLEDLMNITNRQ